MALVGTRLAAAIFLFSLFAAISGNYVIMVPKSWEIGGLTQVCVVVDDASAPPGEITVGAKATKYRSSRYSYTGINKPDYEKEEEDEDTVIYMTPTSIAIPAGKVEMCYDIPLNDVKNIYGQEEATIIGEVAGSSINFTVDANFQSHESNTVLQTDKYLYQPGQMVKFRILTHHGPLMNISTQAYPEVWVTTPSRVRIAQWNDVDNSAGLVHLEIQLADEPEHGFYRIHVLTDEENRRQTTTSFKVEEYVLPRYEVTIEPPKYVLSRDSSFSFKVCAKYTFGQAVNGDVLIKISNNGNRKCQTIITKNETFSGCKEIEVLSSDIRIVDCNINSVYVTVTVAEAGTGIELGASTSISISRNPVTFKTQYQDKYLKFGLPYRLKIKAELPDGSPATDVPVEACYGGSCRNITSPSDGIITININNYASRRVVMKSLVTRADMRDSPFKVDIERYYSPSNSSLQIYAPEGELECVPGEITEHILPVLFASPDLDSVKISVQVISRDRIQFWSSQEYELTPGPLPIEGDYDVIESSPVATGVVSIPLRLPHSVSPSAWVLVWYIREDGEVVSDSIQLNLKKCLPNSVNLRWSTAEAEPGVEASLSLSSEPNSVCSLGVVDKSVELLTPKSNALTVDTFFSSLTNYNSRWRFRSKINDYQYCRDKHSSEPDYRSSRYYTDYVDALKMFDASGVFVFSDLHLETRPCEKQERLTVDRTPYRSYSRGGAYSPPGRQPIAVSSVEYSESSITRLEDTTVPEQLDSNNPRTDFPETWLWDLVVIPPDGQTNRVVTMPDTITEWVGKAVCVHPKKGVGLSERTPITTFTPFFLDLTLPPSIKRGEILPVKISVFNYMNEAIPVTVILGESMEYQILGGPSASLCLDPNNMKVHSIRIRPSVIGDVNITVSAFVDYRLSSSCGEGHTRAEKRDSLIKSIPVEADGFPREKTWTKYVCSDELAEGGDDMESWQVSAPSAIVEGSDRGWVMVVGDLLALSVHNLGHLIRMPYGCGEQNMLNFAPNIYILKYLEATGQDAPEAKEKLLRYMRTGYQRQLIYQRNDGSFSTFGNADESGSTWLSAFVIKSFAQARDYILIDENSLNRTMVWLQTTQAKDGCYRSLGTLFNKAMRGGRKEDGSSFPLTAYIIIALLESGEGAESKQVAKAIKCLTSNSSDNAYIIALQAYAFALAKDSRTQILLDELVSLATDTKTALHWDLSYTAWRSRALEVETAGYAILAMLKWDAKLYEQQIRKVVKWMSTERNGRGGFISTQDTVVALQAMASFEAHLDRGDLDALVGIKTKELSHVFSVQESSKLVQQQVTIPSLPTTVFLELTGEGCVLMQAVLRYNIPEAEPSDAFGLTVTSRTVRDKTCVTKQITLCASYLLTDETSNMVVIELNLVSGYIPEKADLKRLVKESGKVIKRYDVDGSKVSFYLEELTSDKVCGNVRIIREVDVEDAKPGSVVVYDYYQPEFSFSKSYKLPPRDDCLYAW